jgi:hypothetical protein
VTLTVPRGTNQYSLPDTGGTTQYVFLGTWTGYGGEKLSLTVTSSAACDSRNYQEQSTKLVITKGGPAGPSGTYLAVNSSYDSTLGYGSSGAALSTGPLTPSQFVITSNDTQYTTKIYGLFFNYSLECFYTINVTTGSTWTHSGTLFGVTAPTGTIVVTSTPVAVASVWSQFPATQTVSLNDLIFNLRRPNDDLFHYLKYQPSVIDGPELGGYGGGQLVSTAGATPTVTQALRWAGANVTAAGTLTVGPSSGNLTPFLSGGRNYLDINAPAATGGYSGALRLTANNGAQLSLIDNVDLTGPSTNYVTVAIIGINSYLQMQPNGVGGNVLLSAAGALQLGCGTYTQVSGGFNRVLGSTSVAQPVIQTGTGSIATTGTPVNISFSPAYTAAPVIQITGIGSSATAYTYNVSNVTRSGFGVNSTTAIGGTSFYWTAFGT